MASSELPSVWSQLLLVPIRYGHKLPKWGEQFFKNKWYEYARANGVKYTSPITYEIVGDDEYDVHWFASRSYTVKRSRAVPVAVSEEGGGAGRKRKAHFDETLDERARLDLLASHGVVVVSPLRGGQ